MKRDNYLGIKGIFCFVLWFVCTNFSGLPFQILGVDTNTIPVFVKQLYNIIIEVCIIIVIILMFEKQLTKMIKDFKKNNLIYFKKYFKYWFLILGLMMASNAIILIFDPSSTANNQDLINELFNEYPIYTFVLSVLFAPVIEELIFRLSFYNIFKNKYAFILLSGLVFGAFHVIGSYETPFDLVYIIPYSIPGMIFASIMHKTKNVCFPMFLHFVHNGLITSLNILLMLI
jgi:membrane protease YdiL (CAAX protease family)